MTVNRSGTKLILKFILPQNVTVSSPLAEIVILFNSDSTKYNQKI